MNDLYNAIFEWGMTEPEANTFKIAVIWDELTSKMFPNEKLPTLPKRGDPRKSTVFRYCWKLLRETKGLLQGDEYRLYIAAQLKIIQAYGGRIEPNSICGDKAWSRWRVWKRLYDKKKMEEAGEVIKPLKADPHVIQELDKTKRFLFEKCEGQPTIEKLKEIDKTGYLKIWMAAGKISYYYVVLSPFISEVCDKQEIDNYCNVSLKVFEDQVTDDLREFFEREFGYEQE